MLLDDTRRSRDIKKILFLIHESFLCETLSNDAFLLFDTSKILFGNLETLFGTCKTLFDTTDTHLHVRVILTSKIHVKRSDFVTSVNRREYQTKMAPI